MEGAGALAPSTADMAVPLQALQRPFLPLQGSTWVAVKQVGQDDRSFQGAGGIVASVVDP